MSTRALYTFKDSRGTHHVYKHYDGYPYTDQGGFAAIAAPAKLNLAWPLPRFEADEYAAAFIAANKTSPGVCRLTEGGTWQEAASFDIRYRYLIEASGCADEFGSPSDITVVCYEVSYGSIWRERELFRESLQNVIAGYWPEWPQEAEAVGEPVKEFDPE